MRIRKLLPAFIMAAALTLTIPVSVYAAEDDNRDPQIRKKVTATMRVNVTAITLKRGKSYLLKPVLTPSNSTEKKTYTSGNISARCKVTVK